MDPVNGTGSLDRLRGSGSNKFTFKKTRFVARLLSTHRLKLPTIRFMSKILSVYRVFCSPRLFISLFQKSVPVDHTELLYSTSNDV